MIDPPLQILCHFRKQVAPLIANVFRFDLQFGNVRSTQARNFEFYLNKPLLKLLDLPDDTNQISSHTGTLHGFRAAFVLLQNSSQGINIALPIRAVRFRHQPFALGTIRPVRSKVWMDSFRYISVKLLQLCRGSELDCSGSLAMSGRVGFFRPRASFRRRRPTSTVPAPSATN